MQIEHDITTNTRMSVYTIVHDDGNTYEATLHWMDGKFEECEVINKETGELADDDIASEIEDACMDHPD